MLDIDWYVKPKLEINSHNVVRVPAPSCLNPQIKCNLFVLYLPENAKLKTIFFLLKVTLNTLSMDVVSFH